MTDASTPFTTANSVSVLGGTFAGNTALAGINALTLADGFVTVGLDAIGTNIYGGTVTLSGTNRVNIRSVVNHSGYPTTFAIIKATGSMTATTADQWEIGARPSLVTDGYFDTTTDPSLILLVLTNGPQTLRGSAPTGPTRHGGMKTPRSTGWASSARRTFNTADAVLFNDTATST